MITACLHTPANRAKDVAGAWEKSEVRYLPAQLSDADRMNGIEAEGTITVILPIRWNGNDWSMGTYRFYLRDDKQVVTIEPGSSAAWYEIVDYDNWSCAFRRGVRIPDPDRASVPQPSVDQQSSSNENLPPGATEEPH